MFGISGEHLLILGIVLLLFGPRRLPELGNTLGKAIRNFKDAIGGVEEAKYRRLDEERNSASKAATERAAASAATASTVQASAKPAATGTTEPLISPQAQSGSSSPEPTLGA